MVGVFRTASAGFAAVLACTALMSPAAMASSVPAATVAATGVRTDWRGHWGEPGSAEGTDPWASGAEADPVSTVATAAQSRGVALIDTVLPYEGAQGAGTGMVLTSSGQVLTNYHVVADAGTIRVTIAETGKTYSATVVGSDQTDDVALLQLKNASGLSTVKIDDDALAVGDDVTAVGNAGGTGTLTAADGTVSSLKASVTTAAEGSLSSETLKTMIETTADVVAGDSGGPLYDSEGEIVGIDTAASSGSEIDGYAIPIERALSIVGQIRSGQESSTVQVGPAPFLGVELANADSGVGSGYFDTTSDEGSGALIGGVVDDTAASRAGLEAGDEIAKVGGRTVTSADDLAAALAAYDAGDRVRIVWIDQAGSSHAATVKLGASPVA